jgi:ABC-type antimicrobial peptide transport system permease subunit
MLKNYLLIAWRNFFRTKVISLINLTGLILGVTFSLIILFWVEDEKQVDSFHGHSSRIYNIYEVAFLEGKAEHDYSTPGLLSSEMKKRLPEVEYAAVYAWNTENTFQSGDKIIKQTGQYANEDFLKIFNYPLVAGNISAALSSTSSLAISEKMATIFFGSATNAMGKTLRYNDKDDLKVAAVFINVPANSSIQFDYLINWPLFMQQNPWFTNFGNTSPFVTVLLREGTDPAKFGEKIKDFLDIYENVEAPGYQVELRMQRYDEMYLNSQFRDGLIIGGRIEYVNIFSIVAVFILLIACINFMNLSTARAMKRAKEIGVRKVVGANRKILIGQFMTEAMVLSTASVLAAVALVYLLLPSFNFITQKQIEIPFQDLMFWLKVFGIAVATGVVAGLYPAFYISSFDPVKAIKGKLKYGTNAVVFRKGLVVFQFSLSILLIIGTIAVSKQVNFIQTKNIGFSRENLVYIPIEGELHKNYEFFAKKARSIRGVKDVTWINHAPTDIDMQTNSVYWTGKDPNSRPTFTYVSVGYDFIRTMNARMVQGKDFSPAYPGDKNGFIVNEAAVKKIGFENPINQILTINDWKGPIIGVVKDFNFRSLHEPIRPIIIHLDEKNIWGRILVRTDAGKTHEALSGLEKFCKQLNPRFPFTYEFADEDYLKQYKSEQVTGKLGRYFAGLAIFISCLGLLGLVIFSAEQRTKEIGIRKVLGASVASVFALLSKDFVMLVLIAILIATPVAWWAVNNWLLSFEYRVDLHWWMFAAAGVVAIIIALTTISFQAIKSAFANPIKSLRTE